MVQKLKLVIVLNVHHLFMLVCVEMHILFLIYFVWVANAKAFDSSLNTALHYAIAYGWYFCVKLLIEAGANANCVNSWQTTCLAAGFSKRTLWTL